VSKVLSEHFHAFQIYCTAEVGLAVSEVTFNIVKEVCKTKIKKIVLILQAKQW
jgi:hypothetical protein